MFHQGTPPWVEWLRHPPTHMVWADEGWFTEDKWWPFRRGQVFKGQMWEGILNYRLRKVVSMQTEWYIFTDPDDSKTQRDIIFAIIVLGGGPSPKHTPQKSPVLVCPSNSLFWPGKCMEGVVATGGFFSFSVWNIWGQMSWYKTSIITCWLQRWKIPCMQNSITCQEGNYSHWPNFISDLPTIV